MRFEEYPGLPIGNNPGSPLLALRFLEILTPLKVFGDTYAAAPKEGELFTTRGHTGKYAPWGFNPVKPSKRKALTDWIAQSRAKTADCR